MGFHNYNVYSERKVYKALRSPASSISTISETLIC